MRLFAALAVISAFSCAGLQAQSAAVSQIGGTVRASAGLAVAEAQVRAIQTDTGLTRTATTGTDGSYVLPSLPAGPYRLEVSKAGFSTYVQSGIVLQVNSNPTVDVTLKVEAVSEQVTVEAAAAMVETRSTGVGQVVDQKRVVDLPLNGRNATDLIYLGGAAATAPDADLVYAKELPGRGSHQRGRRTGHRHLVHARRRGTQRLAKQSEPAPSLSGRFAGI